MQINAMCTNKEGFHASVCQSSRVFSLMFSPCVSPVDGSEDRGCNFYLGNPIFLFPSALQKCSSVLIGVQAIALVND